MQERECLLVAFRLVKDRIRTLDKLHGLSVPTRVAKEYTELCKTEDYLEKKLIELNEKEGLYEHQGGNSIGQSDNHYLQFGEGSNRV